MVSWLACDCFTFVHLKSDRWHCGLGAQVANDPLLPPKFHSFDIVSMKPLFFCWPYQIFLTSVGPVRYWEIPRKSQNINQLQLIFSNLLTNSILFFYRKVRKFKYRSFCHQLVYHGIPTDLGSNHTLTTNYFRDML